MAIKHSITLSTTEPNNEVGVIKIRQADEQTQMLDVQITENGVPKSYQGLAVYFCAKLGQTAGLGIIEQKLKLEEMTNPANGKLEYTMRAEDWQILGRQRGYFSFRLMLDEHEFIDQFTTRDFTFEVIKSVFSEGVQEVKKDGSTYIWTIEEMIRLFKEYISTGKIDWENYKNDERTIWETYRLSEKINWDDYKLREKNEWQNYKADEKTIWEKFVEDNREFLENADPGGKIVLELLGGRGEFDSLGERLDEVDAQSIRSVYNYQDKDIIVSFMDDDGNPRLMDTIKPIHESENVPANICVIGKVLNTPSQSVTIEQCQQLKSLGWDVGNHTQNHADMTNYSTAQAEMEIEPVANVLKANGLDHDIIVYPYGGYNKNVLDVTRKYNKVGISTEEGINTTPINTFALKRISGIGESGVTLANLKTIIDNAPAGSWIIFKGHTGYESYAQQQTLDDYRALIQYIKAKGIDIVSIKEGLKRKGNILDIGTEYQKFQISVDGKLRFNNTYEDYSIDNATPITHFPYGENVTYFNNAAIAGKGFPTGNNGGTVTTVRLRMDKYASEDASYQTFQPYYENTLYRRRWLVGSSSWSVWEKIAQKVSSDLYHTINRTLNAYTATQLITDYPANTITTFYVNTNGSTGFPVNQAGIVTTYRLGGNGWDRQEFRVYNSNEGYARHTNTSDGSWEVWERTTSVYVSNAINSYTGDTPATSFPTDFISSFRSDTGTPNGIQGVFMTYRIGASGYGYQTFKEYSLNDDFKIYIRNVKSGNAWGAWKEIQFVV